jgi:magnesium-transporting ATPase (P-type)
MLIASYFMFNYSISMGHSVEYARTVAVNIFVFVELFYLFSCKEMQKSVFKTDIMNNKLLLLGVAMMSFAQITFTHATFMNTMFKSEGLDFITWLQVLIISFGILFVVEIKWFIDSKISKKRYR